MSKKNFRYHPLSQEELYAELKKHKYIIETFVKNNHYNSNNVYIDINAIMAIIAKVDQRKRYFEYFHGLNISELKEVALTCFWYIKLRPIYVISSQITDKEKNVFNYINENLAIYYIIVTLQAIMSIKKINMNLLDIIPQNYIEELAYSFKYRDISKEALILLVETMAVFLGINPYKNKKKK